MKNLRRVFSAVLTVGIFVGAGGFVVPSSVSANADRPRPQTDHWHSAFGVWSCDHWLPAIPSGDDPTGIHSHGDGLVHVHPFDERAAGKNAILSKFFESSFLTVTSKQVTLPKGPTLKAGSDCNGKKTVIAAAVWRSVKDKKPKLVTSNLGAIALTDGSVIAIVHAPKGSVPPTLPPSIDDLVEPADLPLPPLSDAELKALPKLPPKPTFDLTGDPPATLETKDLTVGSGASLVKGTKGYMRFVMYIWRTKAEAGALWGPESQPYALARFGKKRNLPGLDKGMVGMKVGGVRRLVLPPSEAFGEEGNGPILPTDTIVFYVQLVSVKK
jgi:hypothetical protein